MKTTRRTFLGGAAVVSLPISTAASAVVHPAETQEDKCRRLVDELLEEFRKLPRDWESAYGWRADLSMPDDSRVSHSIGNDDQIFSEQLIIMMRRPGAKA